MRGLVDLLLWVVLIGWAPDQLVFGVATAAVAAWVSGQLLPGSAW